MNLWRTYLSTGLFALAIAAALWVGEATIAPVRDINLRGRDIFFRFHHAFFPPPPEARDIVLVSLDDETLSRLAPRWPYPRSLYADALKYLKPYHPKAIGFDLIFAGDDFSPESDRIFKEALEDAGNVIVASHVGKGGELGPSALVRESVWGVGIVDKHRDRDRIIRRASPSFAISGNEYPSWELALFEKAFSKDQAREFPRGTDVVINYQLKFKEFPNIPFWRLLEGSVLEKDIRNKIVAFGLTAEVFHDVHATPLGTMPGLAVNANVLLMLMNRSFFSYVSPVTTASLTFFSIWLVVLAAIFSPFGLALVMVSFTIVLYLVVCFLLFSNQVILDPWLISLSMLGTLIGTVIYREGQLLFENLKLREESARDPLTGFYNRRFLVLKLKSEFNRMTAQRSWVKRKLEMSVVMMDLDNFKLVNDSFGHAEGDRVLSVMAETIRSSVRKEELICRYGGDEFCIILANTNIQGAARFAEKICKIVGDHPNLAYRTKDGTDTVRVTASIGVASVTGAKAMDPDKLLKAADRALYRAKSAGRNQVCVFDPVRDVIE